MRKALVEGLLERQPKVHGGAQAQINPELSKVLEAAFAEAEAMKDEYVSTEHLLLAIAAQKDDPAARLLREIGAEREALLKALAKVRGGARVTDPENNLGSSSSSSRTGKRAIWSAM